MKPIILLVLLTALFATALQIVISQHQARTLFVEIQQLEKQRDELNEEWGRLQLEQSTWATDGRVEKFAREELDMRIPEFNNKVVMSR